MSKRDRGDRGALVALGMALAALVLVALIGWLRDPADSQIGQPTTSQITEDQKTYVSESVARADQFNLWRDSAAQWIMALFSVAATGVSIWAVRLLRDTLSETRRAANAANSASDAAQEANSVQREIGQKQVKAYLTCIGGRYNIGEVWAFCGLDVMNSGQSPAKNVSAEVKLSVIFSMANFIDREPIFSQFETPIIRCGANIVAAGSKSRLNAVFDLRPLHPVAREELMLGTSTFQVLGEVRWVDVFGNPDSSPIILAQRLGDVKTVGTYKDRVGKLKTYHDHEDQ